ncbi:unnamed protein product, partial [marine sediment metagenome]
DIAKRKLSAYNLHVRKEMKAGKTMKQAAKSWKGKSSTKQKRRKSTSKPKRSVNKTTKKSSGFRLPGGAGPKAILTGILGMLIIPRFIPIATPGAAKLGTGLALKLLGLTGGGALSTVGIMELAGSFIGPTIAGVTGGGGARTGNGGYDF